jgi:hypothetical protein
MKKLYYLFFYVIYLNASRRIYLSDKSQRAVVVEGSAERIMGVIEFFLYIAIINFISLLIRTPLNVLIVTFIGVVVILFFNFYYLDKKKWKSYFLEFKNFSEKQHKTHSIIVGLIIFAICIMLIMSCYFSFTIKM